MTQNQPKTQIIRKDGKDCLVEVNTQAFSIGKVQFVFAKYNPNNPKGSRTTDRITIFLSFSAALEFAQSILDGRLAKQLAEASVKFQQTKKPWDKNVSISMGGTANPKNRTDGKAESRTLSAQLGTNNPIALIASSGPGTVNDKGLIVPEKPEHSVFISLSASDIREIALMIKAHVEAYIHMEHVRKMWAYEVVNQQNQQQGQGNYNQPTSQQAQQGSQRYQQQGQYQQPNYQNQQTAAPAQQGPNQNYQQGYQQQQQGFQGQQVPFPDATTDNLPF